jgi:hypothetical protein
MTGEIIAQLNDDLVTTLQSEFGQSFNITNLDFDDPISGDFIGNVNDISMEIDPSTGQFVCGEKLNVVLKTSEAIAKFGMLPDKKWKVILAIQSSVNYYVKDTVEDKTLGIIVLFIGN